MSDSENFHRRMNKETLLQERTELFNNILESIKLTPSRIDHILQQAQYYVPIDEENTFFDARAGEFAISIKGIFHNKKFQVYYSLWQLGDIFRIGVAIYDEELHGAFAADSHNEVFYIWGARDQPRVDVTHGCVFYDWEFNVPDLYDSYKNQEKFILGTRHMHFRVMRIIHDECERLSNMSIKDNFGNDFYSNLNDSSLADFEKLITKE